MKIKLKVIPKNLNDHLETSPLDVIQIFCFKSFKIIFKIFSLSEFKPLLTAYVCEFLSHSHLSIY